MLRGNGSLRVTRADVIVAGFLSNSAQVLVQDGTPTAATVVHHPTGTLSFSFGGSTLASYADQLGDYTIPDEHVAFFRELPLCHEEPRYFFVHAGVPEIPWQALQTRVGAPA